jgi:hypothetical protein
MSDDPILKPYIRWSLFAKLTYKLIDHARAYFGTKKDDKTPSTAPSKANWFEKLYEFSRTWLTEFIVPSFLAWKSFRRLYTFSSYILEFMPHESALVTTTTLFNINNAASYKHEDSAHINELGLLVIYKTIHDGYRFGKRRTQRNIEESHNSSWPKSFTRALLTSPLENYLQLGIKWHSKGTIDFYQLGLVTEGLIANTLENKYRTDFLDTQINELKRDLSKSPYGLKYNTVKELKDIAKEDIKRIKKPLESLPKYTITSLENPYLDKKIIEAVDGKMQKCWVKYTHPQRERVKDKKKHYIEELMEGAPNIKKSYSYVASFFSEDHTKADLGKTH